MNNTLVQNYLNESIEIDADRYLDAGYRKDIRADKLIGKRGCWINKNIDKDPSIKFGIMIKHYQERRANYTQALRYLKNHQKRMGLDSVCLAYTEIQRQFPITRNNMILRSYLGIFMDWYTIQLEHIESMKG